ncbi:MAG: nucleoside deaminase [Bacteroidales bacterium]|nr:nucleoside deaminase [Bacteroidales bacterium]MDT8373359.1 nucleoside deaminase [Bacteroidales bacterium]
MTLKSIDREYLELAIDTAYRNISEGGGPFGAVIACNGRIVARAANMVVPSHDPTAHAEIEAIRQASALLGTHDLSECVLYASCEPCPMCLGAIYWAGISRVVYASDRHQAASAGFDDEKIYSELALDKDERSIVMERGLRNQGDNVLRKWVEYPDKVRY